MEPSILWKKSLRPSGANLGLVSEFESKVSLCGSFSAPEDEITKMSEVRVTSDLE